MFTFWNPNKITNLLYISDTYLQQDILKGRCGEGGCLEEERTTKIVDFNPWIMAWWGNPRLMIIGLFSMLLHVKWSIESDFSFSFHRQTKFMELWQFFSWKKVDTIENYMNSGMVREFPPYDFWIILNATLCKIIHRIWFSIYFWLPDKIDGIMAVFSKKKRLTIKNNMIGWHGEGNPALWFSDYFQCYLM